MKIIKVLDCTIRDGGYALGDNCSEDENRFGKDQIKKIILYLHSAGIDYIECGYIKDNFSYDPDKTEYESFKSLDGMLPNGSNYSLMLLGEKYQIENLPKAPSSNLIIRMSFHREHIEKAIEYAKKITKEGYKLFLQPTAITKYTKEEIITMINEFNKLEIEAIAIVDTFGEMMPEDAVRYATIFDEHLAKGIKLGVHLHNNLNMAFSNAKIICETIKDNREVVVDTSLFGMGRGAGNLPTELFVSYLNKRGAKYDLSSLLQANDSIIYNYYYNHTWGYSPTYMLSASYSCHPNYVIYLLNRKKLNSKDIENILNMISDAKKERFDSEYLEELYQAYNNRFFNDKASYNLLRSLARGKEVILIGPGQSIINYESTISNYISNHDCLVITINSSSIFKHDVVFYSNKKRYDENQHNDNEIITSNISIDESPKRIIFDYKKSLFDDKNEKSDSALLMMLQILEKAKITNVTLAGFDGFSERSDANFSNTSIAYLLQKRDIDAINNKNRTGVNQIQKRGMRIITLTPSKYFK